MTTREIRKGITSRASRIKACLEKHPEVAAQLCEEMRGLIGMLMASPSASEALLRTRLARALEKGYNDSYEAFKKAELDILDRGYHWCATLGVMASWGGNMYDCGKCCDDCDKRYPPVERFNGKAFYYIYDVKIRKESYKDAI